MASNGKLQSLDDLAATLGRYRAQGKRVVHCHGVFDLLHIGHVRHFEQARRLGDLLVVTLTPDRFVEKGAGRPAFTETLRAEFLSSLECVDYVAINRWPTAVETIGMLKPAVFAKGSEFRGLNDTTGHVAREAEAVRDAGGEIAFTDDLVYSSSGLINQFLSPFPNAVRDYLTSFAAIHSAADVLAPLRAAEDLRVLAVGEAIIDEYMYCEAIGKSGKEPVLATRFISADRYGGGVLACANHLASFVRSVDVISQLGEGRDEEAFVRSALKPNVTPILLEKPGAPTIVKQRFVEHYLSQKMFEVYRMNDAPLDERADAELCRKLDSILPQYDLVVVADYGHGMLSPAAIETLCRRARFLAVNTQSNAGNHGFNMISKYPRADYVCLAQREVALETRNQQLTGEEMAEHVSAKLDCPRVMITRGSAGILYYTTPDSFTRAPALATRVVDRVGAGDAVLCATALCAAMDASPEVTAFMGNVVGAEAVATLGNQRPVERIPTLRHVECLLKLHAPSAPPAGATRKKRQPARLAAGGRRVPPKG